jgi:hypothetical protein
MEFVEVELDSSRAFTEAWDAGNDLFDKRLEERKSDWDWVSSLRKELAIEGKDRKVRYLGLGQVSWDS